MHLTIGTAQFGAKYGINQKKIKFKELKKIKDIIKKNKIRHFDTSIYYKNSEKIIGTLNVKKKIITKITLPKKNKSNIKTWYKNTLNKSLKKLKVKKLYGLLIHDTSDIFKENKKLLKLILDSKKNKLISKIGISVYETNEVEKVLKFWTPDIIQFPVNIFNQNFIKKKFLKKLKKLGIETYARSCFLQGILLKKNLKSNNQKNKKIFKSYLKWSQVNKISQLTACVHFVKQINYIDSLIVGFDDVFQLNEIIKTFNKKLIPVPYKFINKDKKLIDPRKWR
tara:strand:+ start:2752 stop:3594 length:843 start_codon:yes stop_codon:yes gene_type:complete